MHQVLKETVYEMNRALIEEGLVLETWGNASAADRSEGVIAIKPSGVQYDDLTADTIVVVDFEGKVVAGELSPSVDTPAHLALYRAFQGVNAVIHTHSHYATAFAQARRPIPCLGTTHADYFHGEIPVVAAPSQEEVVESYEHHIGDRIVRHFSGRDPLVCPAALTAGHAPFVWGRSPAEALENAVVLEEVARMAAHTLAVNPAAVPLEDYLLNKHFFRKHGKDAYYGQR